MTNSAEPAQTFSRILFAVDDSAHSRAAVAAVGTLALGVRASVRVLHVWGRGAHPTEGGFATRARAAGSELVDWVAGRLAERGIATSAEVRAAGRGGVAETIALAAAESGADLVALGSRGRSDLTGLLLGSVSHEVLRRVDRPVMVVRPRRDGMARQQIQRILVAVAGTREVPALAEAAKAVALATGARVRVIHVRFQAVSEGAAWIEPDADAETLVETITASLRAAGVAAEGRLAGPSSFVAREVVAAAADWGADLIVTGSERPSELAGLVGGSVDHEIIHLADRAVLVAARPAGEPRPHVRGWEG